MLVQLTITALLARGHFLASPYWSANVREFSEAVLAAHELDNADARLAPVDDTPTTAAQVPELRTALAFAATAQFDLAAATLDTFAAAHPHAVESSWALRRAYAYWHALGHDAEAARTLQQYETRHAAREPRNAAMFFWSRREHLEAAQRREHANTYLARHAKHGPPDLRIVAEAELAADLWHTSCPRTWHGLCVDYTRATNNTPCALNHAALFTVRPRVPADRREALRHATTVARLSRTLDLAHVAPWRRPALRAALGQAALVTSDEAIEAVIAIEYPRGLDFYVEEYKNTAEIPKWQKEYRQQVRRRDASIRRFHRYWDAYKPRMDAAMAQVDGLRTTGSPEAILLGMTRLALAVGEVMDEQEFAIDIPFKDRAEELESLRWWCEPNERTTPWLANANSLLKTCADLVRAGNASHPDLAVCFDGFSRLYGAEDWLPEFFSPA